MFSGAVGGGGDEVGDGVGLTVQGEPAFFGGGHVGDVIGQVGEPLGLVGEHVSHVAGEVGDSVEDALVVYGQGGDRGAQFVGQVGQQTSAGVFDGFQALRHGVECPGQGVQFGHRTHGGYPPVIVTAGELPSGVGELVQRSAQQAGEQPGDRERAQQGDEQGYPKGQGARVPVCLLDVRQFR